jgi:hypothetical protein
MIVYTPIDIPVRVPDHTLLVDYIKNNHMTNLQDTYGYTSLLAAIASRVPVTNWRDANDVFSDNSYKETTDAVLYFPPLVTSLFPELIKLL